MRDYNVNPNTDALVGGGPDLPSQNVFDKLGLWEAMEHRCPSLYTVSGLNQTFERTNILFRGLFQRTCWDKDPHSLSWKTFILFHSFVHIQSGRSSSVNTGKRRPAVQT